MTKYILKRLLLVVPTFIVITMITYSIIRLAPGDFTSMKAGLQGELTRGATVITPYFTMAAFVYQKAEGQPDLTVVDAVDTLLLRPDLVAKLNTIAGGNNLYAGGAR